VKKNVPVFWIEGLGVQRDGTTVTPLFMDQVAFPPIQNNYFTEMRSGSEAGS